MTTRDTFMDYLIGVDYFNNVCKLSESLSEVSKKDKSQPYYNIIKVSDTETRVEMAVAGFSREDLTVTLSRNTLIVEAKRKEADGNHYIHRGISFRPWTRRWRIGNNVEITNVSLENGILKIDFMTKPPEGMKPINIEIK